MTNDVWVGAYCLEEFKYCACTVEDLFSLNLGLFKNGAAGYAPLCFGSSKDEVEKRLGEARALRKKLFLEFESALIDALKDFFHDDVEIRIVTSDGEDEESFVNDGIAIIHPDDVSGAIPVVSLFHYYREYSCSPECYSGDAHATVSSIDCYAQEVIDDIDDLRDDAWWRMNRGLAAFDAGDMHQ